MYLSLDEAGTHVGVKRFRLVAGAYDENGQNELGTGCSAPIRVLANNDVPTGAACIKLHITLRWGCLGRLPAFGTDACPRAGQRDIRRLAQPAWCG